MSEKWVMVPAELENRRFLSGYEAMIDAAPSPWTRCDDSPPKPGWWLCKIHSDDGPCVRTLEYTNKGEWMWEGEPTCCLAYYFEVLEWAPIPEGA
jgi:hypothetical protein